VLASQYNSVITPSTNPQLLGRVTVLEVCLVRSTLSFTMSIILMKSMGMSPLFGHRKNAPLLVARGCCGALSMALYYASLQLLPLGDAVTIGERAVFLCMDGASPWWLRGELQGWQSACLTLHFHPPLASSVTPTHKTQASFSHPSPLWPLVSCSRNRWGSKGHWAAWSAWLVWSASRE